MKDAITRMGWVLCGGVLGVLATLSMAALAANDPAVLPVNAMRNLAEAFGILRTAHADALDDKALIEGCIAGMVTEADPESEYLRRNEVVPAGRSAGIGLELGIRHGQLTVVSAFDNSPAARAGLRTGDRIAHIDGEPTASRGLAQNVALLRGAPGTSVALDVVSEGETTPRRLVLAREIISFSSVKSADLGNGYGYVRIAQFSQGTTRAFLSHVAQLRQKGPVRGLVLDLRNNPGGILGEGLQTSSLLLQPGTPIASTKGRAPGSNQSYLAGGEHLAEARALDALADKEGLRTVPLVVLINGGSAAASEILAGAVRDHGRATVIGTASFGRASVKTLLPLQDDHYLRLTTARWSTPKGGDIGKRGVTPDIEFGDAPSPEGYVRSPTQDPIVARAVDVLKSRP